eukprot:scaffold12903_cov112-Isochrysis_galbana.AAC.1
MKAAGGDEHRAQQSSPVLRPPGSMRTHASGWVGNELEANMRAVRTPCTRDAKKAPHIKKTCKTLKSPACPVH